MPELEGWAIVQADQVGPPASAGRDRNQRLVARMERSHLEVVYDRRLDQKDNPEQLIAEKINLLVMANDPDVLHRGTSSRVELS